jgi:glycosyltransferase involved in cell wall biosynthesis
MINPDLIKNPIKISVIIPVFNVEKYLEKTLESLYQQTLRPENFEIIIIDDNSTDDTLKIVKRYQKKRGNIKIIHNTENLGPGLSRNKGLDIAKGEYVFFLDGDDYLDIITLEQLLIVAYDNGSDLVVSGYCRVDEQGTLLYKKNEKHFFSNGKFETLKNTLEFKINHAVWNKLIQRSLFEENNIRFTNLLHEDVPIVFEIVASAKNIFYYDDFLYYWVKRAGSIVHTMSNSHIDGFLYGVLYPNNYIINNLGYGIYKKLWRSIYKGIHIAMNILVRRIVTSEAQNFSDKKELYKYLIDYIYKEPFLEEALVNNQDQNSFSFNFFKYVYKANDFNVGIQNFEDSIKSKGKPVEKKKLKEEQQNFKKRVKVFIKKYPRLYKLVMFSYKVLKYHGNLKQKWNYFIDRIIKFIYKKRFPLKRKLEKKAVPLVISEEILFICDVDYHIRNAANIVRKLWDKGYSTAIIDMSDRLNYGKRKLKEDELKDYEDLIFYKVNDFTKNIDPKKLKLALFFNDSGIHNKEVRRLRNLGIKTVGIDEGVNDFKKLSEGFTSRLSPYRTPEHVFLPGEFDTQFFNDRIGQFHVVGLPMIRKFLEEKPQFPKIPLIAINVNFSYGVLMDQRDLFIETAVKGCQLAGVDYVITQHPMDDGVLDKYHVTDLDMYDTIRNCSVYISRFSGSIIEALAMGKPCIYHNPHNEKVLKFQEPMGAYSISDSAESLAKAIKYELKRSSKTPVREYSRKFMEYHANIDDKLTPEERSIETIMKLLK